MSKAVWLEARYHAFRYYSKATDKLLEQNRGAKHWNAINNLLSWKYFSLERRKKAAVHWS